MKTKWQGCSIKDPRHDSKCKLVSDNTIIGHLSRGVKFLCWGGYKVFWNDPNYGLLIFGAEMIRNI